MNVGTPSEYGFYVNGLHFTGVTFNGRLVVVADALPVKTKNGQEVHHFEMEERDGLSGEMEHTIVMSKKMYDAVLSDGELEKYKVESLSQR